MRFPVGTHGRYISQVDMASEMLRHAASVVGHGSRLPIFAQIAGVAASQLARVLQKHGERHRRRRAVNTEAKQVAASVDASIWALGMICEHQEKNVGGDSTGAWQMWLSHMPPRYDKEIGQKASAQLLELVVKNHPVVTAPEQLPRVLAIFADVYKSKNSNSVLDKEMASAVARAGEGSVKGLAANLPERPMMQHPCSSEDAQAFHAVSLQLSTAAVGPRVFVVRQSPFSLKIFRMPAVCMRCALLLLTLTQHTSDATRYLPALDPLGNDEFVPERHSFEWLPCNAELVHCGQDYFYEVYKQFQTANEIIVMGWWTVIDAKIFSPTYGEPPSVTMKDLIKKAAERGATIYYLFWQTLLSEQMGYPVEESAAELRALHPNVKTLVDTSRDAVTVLWSAHIKVTIFDRGLAYAGGIDFAGSRLDSARHKLPDEARTPSPGNLKDGQHGYFKPWEDVMVKLTGEVAEDLAAVAVERWWTWCEQFTFFSFTGKKEGCKSEQMPPLTSLGSLSVTLLSKAEGTEQVVLETDGAYKEQPVQTMTAIGQAAVLDLGARRDLSKRAVLNVHVVTNKGHLFTQPPPETSTTPFQGDLCTVVTGGRKRGSKLSELVSKGCTCEGNARVAGKDPGCKTEEMMKQYEAEELLGLGCFCQDYSKTFAVVDLRSDSPKEVTVAGARLQIQHSKKAVALAASATGLQ
ncbi:Phospholipase D C [Symbiodinium microadriaticum]|uniref:phospholipase D n=1 Tax=Symbiodinium microadriaticum TaxID=2951 RepID=A0A1Q9D5D5_SYMMI|nr:Phospholipase D C [Symbiodinium microadriaticum]